MGKSYRKGLLPQAQWPLWALICAGVLLFYVLMVQTGDVAKWMSVALALLVLVCTIGKTPLEQLKQRVSVPLLALFAYVLMNGAASLTSHFGAYALRDFTKLFAAFCLAALVLVRMKREGGRGLLSILAWVMGVISLLCIDASSLKLLSRLFVAVFGKLGYAYGLAYIGYESGIRITGIFANANVSAGLIAFGVLLSLYLVTTGEKARDRVLAFVLLGVNSLAFLLSFSMGGMAAFALAVAVYLIAAGKGTRIRLFLIMVDAFLVSMVMAFVSFAGLGVAGARAVLPVAAALVSGLLMWALDRFLLAKVSDRLNRNGRAAGIAVGALAALLVVYLLLAFQLTGGISLAAGETLKRSVYPQAGEYTVTGDWSGDVDVTILSQNSAQTMMHTETVLYSGTLAEAAFTVPEETKVVYLQFTANSDVRLSEVTLSDGTSLKLGYKLLPGFAANRLQGLWANQNFIQRLVFFRDGLTLFTQSPILGHGLGSVEGKLTSVQSFYYESKYIHNHLIQVMDEMGLIGLACFVTLMVSTAVTLIKRRREDGGKDPILPVLGACLAMMIGHSMTEVVWSVGAYQAVVLLLLAVILVRYAKPVGRLPEQAAGKLAAGYVWVYCVVFGLLVAGNLYVSSAYARYSPASVEDFMADMKTFARLDRYERSGYQLNYIVNAVHYGTDADLQLAARYADDIRGLHNYEAANQLGEVYYLPMGMIAEYFACSREIIAQEGSNSDSWNLQFAAYQKNFAEYGTADPQLWAQEVMNTYDWLQAFNEGRMEEIILTEENLAFVEQMSPLAAG